MKQRPRGRSHLRYVAAVAGMAGAAAAGIGVAILGFSQSSEPLRLIMLEWQGKCDYRPCATPSVYFSFVESALMMMTGFALLVAILLLVAKHRARSSASS